MITSLKKNLIINLITYRYSICTENEKKKEKMKERKFIRITIETVEIYKITIKAVKV